MRYMLDTNICIYLMKNDPPQVRSRLEALSFGEVVMSVVTLAELKCGVSERTGDGPRVAATLERLLGFVPALPFDHRAADRYAALSLTSGKRRRDALDRLIAAHAVAAAATLVTHNLADFRDYAGLTVEDWTAA